MSEKKTHNTENSPGEQTKVREKREPQLITVNGDKISHAHAYKSNRGEDWFFTAKINGQPLMAKRIDPKDVEWVFDKSVSVEEKMQKYYPSVLMRKVNVAEFKLPRQISTGNGEEQIIKFNVYKETNQERNDYGQYKFYAQVGQKKMSCIASKEDLDAYFNRVTTPVQLITKNFGDRLGIAAYYEQFKLPEGINLESKEIMIRKNQETSRYEITAKVPNSPWTTQHKELSYDDRQAYLQTKSATKEQLAAKYLTKQILQLSKNHHEQSQAKQASLGL